MTKLDLTYLESISGGDKSFIQDMLRMFLKTTFPEIEQLRAHASKQEWDQVGTTAHKMKAPVQMLGVPEVSALVLELEQIGKTKVNTEAAPEKIVRLDEYIRELEAEINHYLASSS
jgi:HPt (histidine-containing phosphotransfer) domain-containing protein